MNTKHLLVAAVALGNLFAGVPAARAQGTAFAYQGRLNDGSNPANGSYDLEFSLFNVPTGGSAVVTPLTNSATGISNGLFTVTLDFGPGLFTGASYWLEVGVRTNGAGAFATLSPREPLLPVPYAITAESVLSGGLAAGTYSSPVTFNNASDSFSGAFAGNGAAVTNVNAVALGGLVPSNFWQTAGNTGISASQFIGTTDNKPLTVKVNNTTAFQVVPATTMPNIVGGLASFRPSVIASGVSGAVIVGGNAPSGAVTGFGGGDFQAVYDNDGTVGGGFGNKVGSNDGDVTDAAFATVAGGVFNGATAYAATVAGGDGNSAGGQRSAVLGGFGNVGTADFSSIGGGQQNSIQPSSDHTAIAGGQLNFIADNSGFSAIGGGFVNVIGSNSVGATISGGYQNTMITNAPFATIGGGASNTITAYNFIVGSMTAVTIAGGYQNTVSNRGVYATIGGGLQNACGEAYATVGGGYQNIARGGNDTIGGGYQNSTLGVNASETIAGGFQNFTAQAGAAIGGGVNNTNGGVYSTIGGGENNLITNSTATVSGGRFNIGGGIDSVVPGGDLNYALGRSSFAAGTQAKATNNGAFVWADLQGSDFYSTAENSVSFRCSGGVRFTNGGTGANVAVSWNPGSGSWTFSSDRTLKEGFETVDAVTVLEKVARLPISEWNYQGYSQRHIGVMAQDFHAAFPLNESTTTLNDADMHGVALAAIQGLNRKLTEKLEQKETEITELKQRLERLEEIIRNPKSN